MDWSRKSAHRTAQAHAASCAVAEFAVTERHRERCLRRGVITWREKNASLRQSLQSFGLLPPDNRNEAPLPPQPLNNATAAALVPPASPSRSPVRLAVLARSVASGTSPILAQPFDADGQGFGTPMRPTPSATADAPAPGSMRAPKTPASAADERAYLWSELQRLRSQLDAEQKERRAASFMERVQVAHLRQQTEALRRSLLAHGGGGNPHSPPGSPGGGGSMWQLRQQQEALHGMAELHKRLQEEKARHAGFASELVHFARKLNVGEGQQGWSLYAEKR